MDIHSLWNAHKTKRLFVWQIVLSSISPFIHVVWMRDLMKVWVPCMGFLSNYIIKPPYKTWGLYGSECSYYSPVGYDRLWYFGTNLYF
jgi:hypothetical protein